MRILIATVTAGAGHLQAAAALEEAWRALRPHDTLERGDLLEFVSRLHRQSASNNSPSPGGEGRDEGGRFLNLMGLSLLLFGRFFAQ
ncbi:MAG: hypothetical protein HY298_15455 [Verrucomicrobia bacterium]|nr:hypothetical protein [Verrucomicrobiota bacterium]